MLNAGKGILHGRLISLDFFSRHWVAVAISVLLLVWYITNKYEYKTNMEKVNILQRELDIAKGDYINEHSQFMSSIREATLEELARRHGLNLVVQDEPPYKLKYNAKTVGSKK